jgi:chromosome partitioning protein
LASKYNTWHVLKKKCDINEAIVVTNIPGLDIIPGSLDLTTVEWEMGNALKREERLSQAVSQIKKHYDYILFDCGPNLGIIVINAMAAASELLITMETSYYCSSGVLGLVQTIREVQEYLHPTLRVGGILFTKVERTKEAQRVMNEALELFSAWNYPVYQTKIRKNVKLTEAPAYHLGINAYAPDSAGAEDYLA